MGYRAYVKTALHLKHETDQVRPRGAAGATRHKSAQHECRSCTWKCGIYWKSTPQVLDVGVRAQPRVVRQIPANMVRILVNHDLISGPVPARDDRHVRMTFLVHGDVVLGGGCSLLAARVILLRKSSHANQLAIAL